jgi:hypothetical protein
MNWIVLYLMQLLYKHVFTYAKKRERNSVRKRKKGRTGVMDSDELRRTKFALKHDKVHHLQQQCKRQRLRSSMTVHHLQQQ